jgi:hypothetical protein
MHRVGCLPVFLLLTASAIAGQETDPIVRARSLYNERNFDAAIAAAEAARKAPGAADRADLVAARAYLERYRESATEDDLVEARSHLRRINPTYFDTQERGEYVMGLGAALYFEDLPGAAAALFAALLEGHAAFDGAAREGLLDWWASAVDRNARPRPEVERQVLYQGVRDRMRLTIATNPTSSVAAYWLAAAAAGAGDWEAAWDEAQAAWVRAPLTSDHGAVLMADLDRLVQRAIVPARAKTLGQPAETLLQEWTSFKERWTR